MSSPLAIGAVSAVLRNLLDNGMVDVGAPLGPVTVTAIAPDRIDLDDPDGGPSLNLFLHRVSENQGWRNIGLPSRSAGDGSRVSNAPLALNLHYLLTAYGSADFQAEILLGYGMHLLHERPVLDRAAIRRALDPSPLGPTILPPGFQALVASDLADQVEAITVTMEPIDTEELSRLWSAIQSNYRPSATYVVSVVLIEATEPVHTPLPVLSRGGPIDPATNRDPGVLVEPSLQPPYPTIEAVVPEHKQPAARLGEQLVVGGHHLDGSAAVLRFAHRLLETPNEIVVGASADPRRIAVTLPSGAAAEQAWPAGTYEVTLSVVRPGEPAARVSNVAGMQLAPVAQIASAALARDPGTQHVTVTLGVAPRVLALQPAQLTIGGRSAPAAPHPAPASSLTFDLGPIEPGPQWLRLTVDGVESLLVRRDPPPVGFDPTQRVTVPA
jgi:hypothetical protein